MHFPLFPRRFLPLLWAGCVVLFLEVWFGMGIARAANLSKRFLIRSWVSEDGLPGDVVRSIVQTADGWLWVATAEGLVRFDGIQFSTLEDESDRTLARTPPRTLFAPGDGSVWVATAQGGLLLWRDHHLSRVFADLTPLIGTSPAAHVTQVVQAAAGTVYIVRGNDTWEVLHGRPPNPILRNPQIDAILAADIENRDQTGHPKPGSSVLQLKDRHGRTWTATPGEGIRVTDESGDSEVLSIPSIAPANRISELFEDREGTIWVATGESGLIQIREARVEMLTTSDGLSDRSSRALLVDAKGLWVAPKQGGLDRLENGKTIHYDAGDHTVNRTVSALFQDRSGVLWAATRVGSVFRFQGGKLIAFTPEGRIPSKVLAIAEDSAGRLWLGGEQGLASWDGNKLTWAGTEQGFTGEHISALAAGGDDLWVGTAEGRIFRMHGDQFVSGGKEEELPKEIISGLCPEANRGAGNGSVWITTLGAGLFHFKNGHLTHFGAEEGLPDPRLTCVADDTYGNLWLGSLAGIFCVPKAELSDIELNRRASANWIVLDRADGMLSRECSGYAQPVARREDDGGMLLMFPTVDGIAQIRPHRLEWNRVPPPVLVENFGAKNGSIELQKGPPHFGPGRTRIEIHYTALSYSAPEKVRFQIRLDTLESEWRDVGTQRYVTYEAVPPGHYRFHVRAANNDGIWSSAGAEIAFEVTPHFWERTWFQICSALVAAGIVAGVSWLVSRVRMRERLLRMEAQSAREAERARIAQDLHDDLGASLTEISLLAQLAAEDPDTGTAQEPLPGIAEKAQAVVLTLDEIVWAINPRQDTVAALVDYLAAFAAEFLQSAGIALRLEIPRELPDITLEPECRHALFLSAREALNNAVKHSGAKEVFLGLRLDDVGLEIIVADNGCGFRAEQCSPGEGLRNLRDRLARAGGKCRLDTADSGGASIHLYLPLAGKLTNISP